MSVFDLLRRWLRRLLGGGHRVDLPPSDGPYASPPGDVHAVEDDGTSLRITRRPGASAVVVRVDRTRRWREVAGALLAAVDEETTSVYLAVRDPSNAPRHVPVSLTPRLTGPVVTDPADSADPGAELVTVTPSGLENLGDALSPDELVDRLERLFDEHGGDFFPVGERPVREEFPVALRVDRGTSYGAVVGAIDLVRRPGFTPVFPLDSFV